MQNRASILHAVVCRRLIPIPPAFALDMSPQPAIDQHSLRPFAPRTTQVDRIRRHAIRSCKRTAVEHKAVRLAFGRRRRRHVAVHVHIAVERANLAPLKVGTRAAKDKVDIALDPATSKILAPHPARRILFGSYKPPGLASCGGSGPKNSVSWCPLMQQASTTRRSPSAYRAIA